MARARAVETAVAMAVLVLLTVALAALLYHWLSGSVQFQGEPQRMCTVYVDAVKIDSPFITLYLHNSCNRNVTIDYVYIMNAYGCTIDAIRLATPFTVPPRSDAKLTVAVTKRIPPGAYRIRLGLQEKGSPLVAGAATYQLNLLTTINPYGLVLTNGYVVYFSSFGADPLPPGLEATPASAATVSNGELLVSTTEASTLSSPFYLENAATGTTTNIQAPAYFYIVRLNQTYPAVLPTAEPNTAEEPVYIAARVELVNGTIEAGVGAILYYDNTLDPSYQAGVFLIPNMTIGSTQWGGIGIASLEIPQSSPIPLSSWELGVTEEYYTPPSYDTWYTLVTGLKTYYEQSLTSTGIRGEIMHEFYVYGPDGKLIYENTATSTYFSYTTRPTTPLELALGLVVAYNYTLGSPGVAAFRDLLVTEGASPLYVYIKGLPPGWTAVLKAGNLTINSTEATSTPISSVPYPGFPLEGHLVLYNVTVTVYDASGEPVVSAKFPEVVGGNVIELVK